VGITEWDSLDAAVAWRNGNAWKDLAPQRDKAIKIIRQFVVEAQN
jgi:heme-degrading monooxygenase HmoA